MPFWHPFRCFWAVSGRLLCKKATKSRLKDENVKNVQIIHQTSLAKNQPPQSMVPRLMFWGQEGDIFIEIINGWCWANFIKYICMAAKKNNYLKTDNH